jgi:DnaD/phage-associated family protein
MKIKLNYNDKIINVPAEAVVSDLSDMTAEELRVLLYLCAEPGFRADTESGKAYAIKTLDMQWAEIEHALSSLTARGIITSGLEGVSDHEQKPKKAKASVKADCTLYSKDETAGIIERNADLHRIIHIDVPRIIGKAVGQNETMILVSLYDYLRLSAESIVKIIEYCCEKGSPSFRVIERTAYSMFDNNITTPEEITAFAEREKLKNSITEQIRELFGIGSRALITKEKNLISAWVDTYGYGMDMIERAYELTIKAINKPSLDYAGSIMKRWFENGIKTPEETEKDAEQPKTAKHERKAKNAESFDADEFMDAAMKRSYGNN